MIREHSKHRIEGVAENEDKLCVVHKHPFGIIGLYVQTVIALVAVGVIAYFVVPSYVTEENRLKYGTLISVGLLLVVSIMALIILLANYIYRQNMLIVTNKNLTQVLQTGLFTRQVSELSMANVEDVTAFQSGFLATIFDYGELRVETAGEQNNFRFTYCPRPNYYGKIILDARQRYIDSEPEHAHRANEKLNVPHG